MATLYSALQPQLSNNAIAIVEDDINKVLVFVPNNRSVSGLVASLSTVNNARVSASQIAQGTLVSAQYTNTEISSSGAKLQAAINFTSNPQQIAYRLIDSTLFQGPRFVSFWIKNPVQFTIGAVDNLKNPISTDYVGMLVRQGQLPTIYLNRTWSDENGRQHNVIYQAQNPPMTKSGFNHVVVSLDKTNKVCYFNGIQVKMPETSVQIEPVSTADGYFVIGPAIYGKNYTAANGIVKSVSIFPATTNATLVEELYSLGENGDPRTIGLMPTNYWPLDADTNDLIDTAHPLTQQLINFTF